MPMRRTLSAVGLAALCLTLLVATPRAARSDGGCKPDGKQCQTNISCCSRSNYTTVCCASAGSVGCDISTSNPGTCSN